MSLRPSLGVPGVWGNPCQVRPPVVSQRNPSLYICPVLENSWELCPFLPHEHFRNKEHFSLTTKLLLSFLETYWQSLPLNLQWQNQTAKSQVYIYFF